VAGFMQCDYSLLQTGMRDRLHQPERAALVPGMPEVLAAAEEAGALGAALSGAGPTLLALVAGEPEPVAAAMAAAWAGCGIAARTMILDMAEAGVQVKGHGC
jgi:homoserine kinase